MDQTGLTWLYDYGIIYQVETLMLNVKINV